MYGQPFVTIVTSSEWRRLKEIIGESKPDL